MISIGVVFYHEPESDIEFFLKGLRESIEATIAKNIEIKQVIFVLNSNAPKIKKILVNFQKTLFLANSQIENILIQNTVNNIGLARKLIIERSTANWVYFTDPDVILQKNTLAKLGEESLFFTKEQTLGITGPIDHLARSKFLKKLFSFNLTLNNFFNFAFQGTMQKAGAFVDHAPTAHFLLNKKIVEKLGNFSPEFPSCGEDLDITHRATQNGYFIYFGTSQVTHQQNFNTRKALKKFFYYGQAQASTFMKNGYCFQRLYRLIPAVVTAILFLLALFLSKKTFLFLLVIFASMTLFMPQISVFLLTVIVYGSGTIFRFIFKCSIKNKELFRKL